MAVGFLIACASGLCSLVFFAQSMKGSGGAAMLPLILLFGGIPFFIGTMIFGAGRAVFKKSDTKEKKDGQP